ncbi:MAG: PilZ domain-containing protein [Actinomycetia bacterium]|nr:PilZ domain-containing protein [Actinomycetes bacterium]
MSYEKRVGERMDVGDLRVRWTRNDPEPRRRRRRKGPVAQPGHAYLRNVSASGAGVVAPTDPTLTPGKAVEVHVDDNAYFVARIRRVIPTTDAGWCFYGIEIADESPGFREWLTRMLDINRESVITESHWRSAY